MFFSTSQGSSDHGLGLFISVECKEGSVSVSFRRELTLYGETEPGIVRALKEH